MPRPALPPPPALFIDLADYPMDQIVLSAEEYATELSALLFDFVMAGKLTPSYRLTPGGQPHVLDRPGCRAMVERLVADDHCLDWKLLWPHLMPEASACITVLRARRKFEALSAAADVHLAALRRRMNPPAPKPLPPGSGPAQMPETSRLPPARPARPEPAPLKPLAIARARAARAARATQEAS